MKENIKGLYSEMSKRPLKKNVKICDKTIWLKGNNESLESLDLKVIEARKKLDLLQHEINQKQGQIIELSTAHTSRAKNKRSSNAARWIRPSANTIHSLENQIQQTEINIMEVEYLHKKYRSIKNQLIDESVCFESTLTKLEEKINQQEKEIANLQISYKEAIHLRDTTNETLKEQEKKLHQSQHMRELEMEELKSKVETYKTELEKLECQMYPNKIIEPDGQSGLDHDDVEINHQSAYLKSVFETLKEATGAIENEDVLQRFLTQKDTRNVLEKMKLMSENKKKQLIEQKEKVITELETYKFAEIKDQEKSKEQFATLQGEVLKETENYERIKKEHEKREQQITKIMQTIHKFCLLMKKFDVANVPEKCPPNEKCEWLLRLFRTKMESALRHVRSQPTIERRDKNQNMELWSALPFSIESKVSDIEEEEEIPTRNGLKHEAQLIYEARSQRRGYRPPLGKQF